MTKSKVAFLTEMGFEGKVPSNHSNMRTEFSWIYTLNADHRSIHHYREVKDYDHVFIIFPKGKTFLSAEGSKLVNGTNPVSELLRQEVVNVLRVGGNKKIHYVQEGPHWWYNDYEVGDQIYFYNLVAGCDSIFAHNESDTQFYKGMFPGKPVHVIPSLMIEESVGFISTTKEDKVIIGGNFARWYGGFESYTIASIFDLPIWAQTSHATRVEESLIAGLKHLPRMLWTDWITALSEFKYAVHLMPTVAAGTFSLNCAYLGIPCIGNEDVDTQRICHPALSVKVSDVEKARELALRLKQDKGFYQECSRFAKYYYKTHYSLEVWKERMNKILNEAE
jgi:hypothetical protein